METLNTLAPFFEIILVISLLMCLAHILGFNHSTHDHNDHGHGHANPENTWETIKMGAAFFSGISASIMLMIKPNLWHMLLFVFFFCFFVIYWVIEAMNQKHRRHHGIVRSNLELHCIIGLACMIVTIAVGICYAGWEATCNFTSELLSHPFHVIN